MLNVAKNYALSQGYGVLIGTVHPQNKASIKAMAHISKEFNKGEVYHHTTKSGRTLEREKFNIKL